ncbi:MAG TPA: carbamoyl phosphate synthase large subunit, partial [Flavobacterium sp.]|nr:carbamoyl phosphate synthase large subunit [Flavobacterium sp.]
PACQISDGYKKVLKVTDSEYINELLSICKQWDIKLIIPTIDTELTILANNESIFLEHQITIVLSKLFFVEKCRDKRKINVFFEENNIDIPREINKSNPTFPLFIKPYDGSLSKDIFLINEKSELTKYHLENPKFMFMEYINPAEYDEFTVDTYYNKSGNLKCAVPRKRIFVRSGEINKGVTNRNEIVDYVKNNLSFIEGARGCLTIQFFFSQKMQRIVGIEINPRFGGGYPLSYLAGANFPKWIIQEYILNQEIPYFDAWEDKLLMLRYDHEILVHNYEY